MRQSPIRRTEVPGSASVAPHSCAAPTRNPEPGTRNWRAVLVLGLVLAATCAPKHKDRIALVGGNIISGAGDAVLRDAVIVVYQGRIETVAPREGFDIPKTATEIDVTGRWIIPGLIDGHTHIQRWAMGRYVAAGVTSVRDLHGQGDSILALKEEVSLGGEVAPGSTAPAP